MRSINEELLALEKGEEGGDRVERFARLFRAAHSLKGAARAVEMPAIEQLSHHLEDVFTAMRDETVAQDAELFSLLFRSADAIEAAGMQLREKAPLDNSPLEALLPELQNAIGQEATETSAEPEPPPPQKSVPEPSNKETSSLPSPTRSPEPKEPSQSPAKVTPGRSGLGGTVRVTEDKLDSLLAQMGELLVARQLMERTPAQLEALAHLLSSYHTAWFRSERPGPGGRSLALRKIAANEEQSAKLRREQFRQLEKAFENFRRELVADVRQLQHASAALQDDVHRIRMVPFQEVGAGLERTIRDLATASGKEVQLLIQGGEIEVDRSVLEGLRDPLLHLVRNAVDHGIESPDLRKQRGKPVPATIRVEVSLRGSQVEIILADDGQGIDLDRIRQKLREKGMPEPEDEQLLLRQIFQPGFSTASIITDVSGRGVGMDVVKSQLESMRGTVEVATSPGEGTRFTLSVPLTLTTIPAIFLKVSGQTFAVPTGHIQKLIRFHREELHPTQNGHVIPFGDTALPVVSLSELLGLESSLPIHKDRPYLGVVFSVGDLQAVAIVEEVLSEQEIVLKNLGPRVRRTRFVSGATLLPSGQIALLLNVPSLLQFLAEGDFAQNWTSTPTNPEVRSRRVLLVDDALTTRTLFKSILEEAGYDVLTAVDGRDAWEILQNNEVDLVVSDVDMPRLDGFQLTKMIRGTTSHRNLPVVLITARDSDEDKKQGVQSGADAYLVKSAFHQTHLLETIAQLL